MKKLCVIASKDVGEAFSSRSVYVFLLVMLLVTFSYVSTYNRNVSRLANPQAIESFSRDFLNSLAYLIPLMYSIIICSIFSNYSVTLDKAKRNIESLMATPVGIKQIWIGKSLAVTLPSVAIGLAVSILVYSILNVGFVMPHTHAFIFPAPVAILSALLVIPVLVFAVVTVVIYIQLIIANPRIANFVFTGMFILTVFGVNFLGGIGVSLTYFPLVYLAVAALCGLASLVLSRYLTKEKVLLSSKA